MDIDSQPYLTSLNESTFLLCKPDVEKEHGHILQLVSDAGFQVQARSFVITPAVAKEIASLFGSVQQRLQQDKEQGCATTQSRATGPRPPTRREGLMHRYRNHPPQMGEDGVKTSDSLPEGRIVQTHRSTEEAHNGLMADIRRLTMRHRGTEAGVNAGLPSSAETSTTALLAAGSGNEAAGAAATAAAAATSETETRASSRGGTSKNGRPVSAAGRTRVNSPRSDALGVREQLHAMSYAELLQEHVRHLALHGTCLAVLLSAPNAVERLLSLVGPEDPLMARRVAPHSLRARLGSDVVRNAVYAAANLADAATCIRLVFGYSSAYDTQPALDANSTNRNVANGLQSGEEETWPAALGQDRARSEARITGAPLRLRPGRQALHLPSAQALTTSGADAPVPFAALVPTPAECPAEWRVSYYIDDPQSNAWWMDELSYGAAAYAAQPSADAQLDLRGEDNAEQRLQLLQRRLSEEKARLAQQATWLQQREMDLLLREQALQDALRGQAPTALLPLTPARSPLGMMGHTERNVTPALSPLRQGNALIGSTTTTTATAPTPFSLLRLPRRPSEAGSSAVSLSVNIAPGNTNPTTAATATTGRIRVDEMSFGNCAGEDERRQGTVQSSPITAVPRVGATRQAVAELLRDARRSNQSVEKEEDVIVSAKDATALVTQPARQWALFEALAANAEGPSDVIPIEAVVRLYERSPALRGVEADEARGTARLRRFIASVTTSETCDFNTFALILAHLLKE